MTKLNEAIAAYEAGTPVLDEKYAGAENSGWGAYHVVPNEAMRNLLGDAPILAAQNHLLRLALEDAVDALKHIRDFSIMGIGLESPSAYAKDHARISLGTLTRVTKAIGA